MIRGIRGVCATLLLWSLPVSSTASDVLVYHITTSTGSDVTVDIRCDIKNVRLLTFGVKVGYDPAVLEVQTATKNEAVWFLGELHPYTDPNLDLAGEILIWGARFDPVDPFGGVDGQAVQLGEITFQRVASGDPALTLDFAQGEGGDYQNFVTTTGASIDATGVTFLPEPAAGSTLAAGIALLAGLVLRRRRD
jgi:hypothetical protein